MPKNRSRTSKLMALLVLTGMGGSVFQTCATRFKDAFVQGATQVLYSTLLNPAFYLDEEEEP